MRKAVEPLVDVFARSPDGPNRAISLRLRLAEANDQPPELQGSVFAFRCQPPDQALFQFAALGTVVTVKRQGQRVWVGPASRLRPLLEEAASAPPTKEDKEPLPVLRLKVPKALLWLGARFVGIKDAGTGMLNGLAYRKVEVNPPTEFDKPDKGGKGSWVHFWIGMDRYQISRIDWQNPDSSGTLLLEDVQLSPSLPPGAFQPDLPAQREDLMELTVPRYHQLMRLVEKQEKQRAKAQVERQRAAAGEAVR